MELRLAKAGYLTSDVIAFLDDLSELSRRLGLIAVGILPTSGEWYSLTQLQALSASIPGRRTLGGIHLRIYSEEDFLDRWNGAFRWPQTQLESTSTSSDPIHELNAAIRRRGATRRDVANGIDIDPSFLSKVLSGKKPCPPALRDRILEWCMAPVSPSTCAPPVEQGPGVETRPLPLLPVVQAVAVGKVPMLDVAMAYWAWGWTVIPRNPATGIPHIQWMEFGQRRPTVEEIQHWWTNYAG